MEQISIEDARRAKVKAAEAVRHVVPVAGVGVTKVGDGFAVKVNLFDAPSATAEVPTSIDGVPIIYEVVGRTSARSAS
jgi:hypothetical protein